jgi:transcriptional regulator with XRE-family HTH domain
MRIDWLQTNDAVLRELGRRLASHRLQGNRTQAEVAEEAGIGTATLQRLERGQPVQTVSLVKLLRALGLLGVLESAVPESVELPIAELERRHRGRRRARSRSREASAEHPSQAWRWGEDPEATE